MEYRTHTQLLSHNVLEEKFFNFRSKIIIVLGSIVNLVRYINMQFETTMPPGEYLSHLYFHISIYYPIQQATTVRSKKSGIFATDHGRTFM